MADNARSWLDGIEICRGVAATAVVLYHAARHLDRNYHLPLLTAPLQFGHAGVDLFFVISGFIILYVHYDDIGNPGRIGRYANRRFTRVMPTYWVALGLTAAMGISGSKGLPSLVEWAYSLSLVPSNRELILGVAWTLRYELMFYAIFCILLLRRSLGIAAMGTWLVAVLINATGMADMSTLPNSLFSVYNLEFFFGMAAAYALRNRRIPAPALVFAAGVALFGLVAVAEELGKIDGYADCARIAYGVPAMAIVLGAAAIGRGQTTTPHWLLRALGSASYSIYLFQFIFIGILWQLCLLTGLTRLVPPLALFPLIAAGPVIGGVLVSQWIEHPLIRLTRTTIQHAPRLLPSRFALRG